jgi:hypothetical protein
LKSELNSTSDLILLKWAFLKTGYIASVLENPKSVFTFLLSKPAKEDLSFNKLSEFFGIIFMGLTLFDTCAELASLCI